MRNILHPPGRLNHARATGKVRTIKSIQLSTDAEIRPNPCTESKIKVPEVGGASKCEGVLQGKKKKRRELLGGMKKGGENSGQKDELVFLAQEEIWDVSKRRPFRSYATFRRGERQRSAVPPPPNEAVPAI